MEDVTNRCFKHVSQTKQAERSSQKKDAELYQQSANIASLQISGHLRREAGQAGKILGDQSIARVPQCLHQMGLFARGAS